MELFSKTEILWSWINTVDKIKTFGIGGGNILRKEKLTNMGENLL